MIAGGDGTGRTGARDQGMQAIPFVGDRLEQVPDRGTGHAAMGEVVGELVELVEHDAGWIPRELVAGVVDLLDVALGAGGANDVLLGIERPPFQPVEPLPAHLLGQHRRTPATQDPRDRDAAPAVVAGGRPDGLVRERVESTRDQSRDEAGVGRQHLVRGDHREGVTEDHHDPGAHAADWGWNLQVRRHRACARPVVAVVPVNPEQVARMRLGRARVGDGSTVPRRRGHLRESGQDDSLRACVLDGALEHPGVPDFRHHHHFGHLLLPQPLDPAHRCAIMAHSKGIFGLNLGPITHK